MQSSLSVSLLACLAIITTECAENLFPATQLEYTQVYGDKRVHAQSWSQVGDTNGSLIVAYLSPGEDTDFKESFALIDAKKEKVLVLAGLFRSLESCPRCYAAKNENLKKWLHSFLGSQVELVTEKQVIEKAESYLHDEYEQANSIEGEMLATVFDRTSDCRPQVRRFIFSNVKSTPDCYFGYNRAEIGSSQFAQYLYSSDKGFGCPHSAGGTDFANRDYSLKYIANNYDKSLFSAITRVGSNRQQAAAINLTEKQVSIYNLKTDHFRSYAVTAIRSEYAFKQAVTEQLKQKRTEVYNLLKATKALIEKHSQQDQRKDNTAIVICIDWGDEKGTS